MFWLALIYFPRVIKEGERAGRTEGNKAFNDNVVCPICLSLLLGVSCVKAILKPLLIFFFHCSYASRFWHIILEAFDWFLAYSDNMFEILASFLVASFS